MIGVRLDRCAIFGPLYFEWETLIAFVFKNPSMKFDRCLILRKPTLNSTTTNFHELFVLFNSQKYAFLFDFMVRLKYELRHVMHVFW